MKMRAADSKRLWPGKENRTVRFAVCGAAAASLLAAQMWAGPESARTTGKTETASEGTAMRAEPNYALEERFLPDEVSKLVFDLAVTRHWFSECDRFWDGYQKTEGRR